MTDVRRIGATSLVVVALIMTMGAQAARAAPTPTPLSRTALAAVTQADVAPAALPGHTCATQFHNGSPVGSSRCTVASGLWQYYQAFVTYFNDCSSVGNTLTSTIRVQILARRGATGVLIGGVWVVYQAGQRRYGSLRFNWLDGNSRVYHDARNNNGGFTHDIADLFNSADISRYGYTESSFQGLPWGRNNDALLMGQFNMANNTQPYLSGFGTCTMLPLTVVFLP
jgi:hypothetical protein